MVARGIPKQEIFSQAIEHIADVFSVPVGSLKLQDRFDTELHAGFVSDFRENEFDKIYYDILDVADRGMVKKLHSGEMVINTVEAYCEYMWACYENKPKDVSKILGL